MNFTFGIITGGGNEYYINSIIDSIEIEKIPNYEIIIVGGDPINRNNTIHIPFNETIKRAWITKKKNLITENAKYDNIVYLHDYIKLESEWYQGQLKAGNDFKIRMDIIETFEGNRFRDWCIWPHNGNHMDGLIGINCLIPYDMGHLSKYQYISGSYWVAKKDVMTEFKLNENLNWGEGEDVLWSKEVRNKYNFNMNVNSKVKIMKPNKDRVFNEPTVDQIKILNNII